jgi:hypothetical protein
MLLVAAAVFLYYTIWALFLVSRTDLLMISTSSVELGDPAAWDRMTVEQSTT